MNTTPLKEIKNSPPPPFQNSELRKRFVENNQVSPFKTSLFPSYPLCSANKENDRDTTTYLKEKIELVAKENEKLNEFLIKKDAEFRYYLCKKNDEISKLKENSQNLTLSNTILQETLSKKQSFIQKKENEIKELTELNSKLNLQMKEYEKELETQKSHLAEQKEELRIYSELELRSESLIAENMKLSETLKKLSEKQNPKNNLKYKGSDRNCEDIEDFKTMAKKRIRELKEKLKFYKEETARYKEDAFFYQEELANALTKLTSKEKSKPKSTHIENHMKRLREEIRNKGQMLKDPSFLSSVETAHEGNEYTYEKSVEKLCEEKNGLIMELDLYKDIDSKVERLIKENERLNRLLHENSKYSLPSTK